MKVRSKDEGRQIGKHVKFKTGLTVQRWTDKFCGGVNSLSRDHQHAADMRLIIEAFAIDEELKATSHGDFVKVAWGGLVSVSKTE